MTRCFTPWLIALSLAAGCGDVIKPAADAAIADAPTGADAATDSLVAATECANPSGATTVFVNTNGGTYSPASSGVSIPAQNEAVSISQVGTLSGWQVSTAVAAEMLDCFRLLLAPYDVRIVDVEPSASVPYHEVVITSSSSDVVIPGVQIPSIGELGCNPLPQSVLFAFTTFSDNPLTVCRSAASVFGFTQGLSRVMDVCEDAMTNTLDCPGDQPVDFLDGDQICGRQSAMPCNCDQGTMIQNSHQRLLQTLRACPG